MFLFLFGAIVATAGVIGGVYLGGYLAEREGRKGEPKQHPSPAAPAETPPAPPAEKRRLWFVPANRPDQALLFQTWASANFQNGELRTWIAGLSKEQIHALAEQLAAFCTSLGFNLDWLANQRLSSNPSLESAAITIVEHYCTACLDATTVQGAFQQFKKALDLIEQPFSREHKPITQKLYAELVRRNAAEPMSPDLMVASEQARQEHIARMLKEISTSSWTTFMDTFEEVTRVDPAAKPKEGWGSTLRRPFRQRETVPAVPVENSTINLDPQAATTK